MAVGGTLPEYTRLPKIRLRPQYRERLGISGASIFIHEGVVMHWWCGQLGYFWEFYRFIIRRSAMII